MCLRLIIESRVTWRSWLPPAHILTSVSPCHLIYFKGQIAICLKAFYDGPDMLWEHSSSCEWDSGEMSEWCVLERKKKAGLMQPQHTGSLFCRFYLCIGLSPCLIHYPEGEMGKVEGSAGGPLLLLFIPASLSPSSSSHGSPPSRRCECIVPAQQAFIVIESAAY